IHLAHSPGLVRSFGPGGFMRLAIFMAIAAIPSTAIYALVRPPNFPLSFILLALVFSVALQGAGRTAQFVANGKPLANAGISGWAINTGLVVIGIVVAVALLEAALRVHNPLEYRVRGSEIVLPTSTKVVYRDSMPVPGRSDALIELTRNKLGFRGPDAPPDFDVWLTILTVGGSTTEDVSLTDGKTWTDRLQQMLAPAFSKLWVNNAGFVGHSSHAHVQLLRRFIVPMRPDVVIFLVGINDMGRDQLPDTFASYDDNLSARKNQIRPLFDILADHSEVGSLLYNLDRAMRA
ncbi:MAG: SGNH/GDSL hydrolase family protein, partial [Rhodospirillaceae bacterium]